VRTGVGREASSRAQRLLGLGLAVRNSRISLFAALSIAACCDFSTAFGEVQQELDAVAGTQANSAVARRIARTISRTARAGRPRGFARTKAGAIDAMTSTHRPSLGRATEFITRRRRHEIASPLIRGGGGLARKIASVYLRDDRYAIAWGSRRQGAANRRSVSTPPGARSRRSLPDEHDRTPPGRPPRPRTVIKVSQAISGAIVLEMLIER